MINRVLLILLVLAMPRIAGAQQAGHGPSPYAGFEQRAIKALSSEQIADLRNGRGMALALAAELNGYPGPLHVLELGPQLRLTDEQLARVRALFAAMKAEAVPIGERLIAQEAELDRMFAGKTITADSLVAATGAIGQTQAALRAAHLKYHLATLEVLTAAQAQRYSELRGYTAGQPPTPHGHHSR
jgi:Spy/CpxP family protein refolding chaperone